MDKVNYTRGRRYFENYAVKIDNPFMEDFTRILHSKSYRRLANKTQVVSLPRNVYARNRLTHTGEVIAIATSISEKLGLNTSLCLAIATGHDIGHVPYGHLGEEVLSEILGKKFKHNIGSVIVAQHIEKRNQGGLNLTFETLQGMLLHSRTEDMHLKIGGEVPNEYSAVMFADKIAYTFSDLNDALRYRRIRLDKLPKFILKLGKNQDERIYNVLKSLINESLIKDKLDFSEGKIFEMFKATREFMFNEVYKKIDHDIKRIILKKVFEFLSNDSNFYDVDPKLLFLTLSDDQVDAIGRIINEGRICNVDDIKGMGILDSAAILRGKKIDLTDIDLNWGEKRIKKYLVSYLK